MTEYTGEGFMGATEDGGRQY